VRYHSFRDGGQGVEPLNFRDIKSEIRNSSQIRDGVRQVLGEDVLSLWRLVLLQRLKLLVIGLDVLLLFVRNLVVVLGDLLGREFLGLDQDFVLEGLRGGEELHLRRNRGDGQGISEDLLHDLDHGLLLRNGAVVLDGEDQRVWGGLEGVLLDGVNHVRKEQLGGEGVAVVDDGLAIVAIPAVQLNTLAPLEEGPLVGLDGGGPLELVLHQVGVVGGGNKVVIQGLVHVLVNRVMEWVKDVERREKVPKTASLKEALDSSLVRGLKSVNEGGTVFWRGLFL